MADTSRIMRTLISLQSATIFSILQNQINVTDIVKQSSPF